MWRTVIVTHGEKLTIKDNWLVVFSDNTEQRVPIGNLYSVVIDKRSALISVNALVALAEANVPASGSVRVLTITEKQYSSMKLLAGEKLSSEKLLDTKDIIEL